MADITIRFWGVRGSIPTPEPDKLKYGGDTLCIEMRCGEHVLIFDMGTGLRHLGKALMAEGVTTGDIFITHMHLDHVYGLPFFIPAYQPQNSFRMWAGHLDDNENLHDTIDDLLRDPLTPVNIGLLSGITDYMDFRAGETLTPYPDLTIRTCPLVHPGNATGYRIDYKGKSVCLITDTEHTPGQPDAQIAALVEGTDVMLYDATYTDSEFPDKISWGHSTWEEACRVAEAAGVSRPVFIHHDPDHNDTFMDHVAEQAAARFPGALVARQGMTLEV